MGYPMTYWRVVNRNSLDGGYDPERLRGYVARGLVAGDLRRLELDQQDEHHVARYAASAGITSEQAALVLAAFFTDFGAHDGG